MGKNTFMNYKGQAKLEVAMDKQIPNVHRFFQEV